MSFGFCQDMDRNGSRHSCRMNGFYDNIFMVEIANAIKIVILRVIMPDRYNVKARCKLVVTASMERSLSDIWLMW